MVTGLIWVLKVSEACPNSLSEKTNTRFADFKSDKIMKNLN